MGRTLLGQDAMPKTVQKGKVQASLQNFFRPKAPPIFKSVVAAAPAALAEPEPVADPLLADCQWLLNLSADNDNTVVVVESDDDTDCVVVVEEEDVDGELSVPEELQLDKHLMADLKAYVVKEEKERHHVWKHEEKMIMLKICAAKNRSVHGTIKFVQRNPFFVNNRMRKIKCEMLRGWKKQHGMLGGDFKSRG